MATVTQRYLRYIKKRLRSRIWKNAILTAMFLLLFLYPLINYELIQNKTYISIFSRGNTPLNSKVDSINEIDGILLTAYISFHFSSEGNTSVLLIEVTDNFKVLAYQYLISGRFPRNQNEVIVVNKPVYNVSVGEKIDFNSTSYIVVGKVSTEIKNLVGDSPQLLSIIGFTSNKPKRITAAILSVSVLNNYEKIISKLENIFGNDVQINTFSVREYEQLRLINVLIASFAATAMVSLLAVINMRPDSAILFSLGWRWKDILIRVYIELIIISMLGYVGALIILYGCLLVLRLYPFINFLLLSPLAMIFISLLPVYIFSKYLIVKTGVEVLLE